ALRAQGPWAVITVSDNGVGIPPSQQDRIFDIFAQVAEDGRMNQEGLGIGLALVKQLVELHGGHIALQSSVSGEGSTFEVQLPLAD
ncbi:MAG: ATP-binding protein, partial [Blastomonas sp.]|nr:ATP-binding protein [Blastomonas sp.]